MRTRKCVPALPLPLPPRICLSQKCAPDSRSEHPGELWSRGRNARPGNAGSAHALGVRTRSREELLAVWENFVTQLTALGWPPRRLKTFQKGRKRYSLRRCRTRALQDQVAIPFPFL